LVAARQAFPLLDASTADWGVHRASTEVESIRVDFLMGHEVPEIFRADVPNAGQMFLGDKLAYKLRHEYGVAVAEFRGAVRADLP
jgi:hypothetical protein